MLKTTLNIQVIKNDLRLKSLTFVNNVDVDTFNKHK